MEELLEMNLANVEGKVAIKVIIAGGRAYKLAEADFSLLDGLPIEEVVSGGAKGVDSGGESWAESRGIPVKRFLADWKRYGRGAGPKRNLAMAKYADAVALFPGGKGTASMRKLAEKEGILIYDFTR